VNDREGTIGNCTTPARATEAGWAGPARGQRAVALRSHRSVSGHRRSLVGEREVTRDGWSVPG